MVDDAVAAAMAAEGAPRQRLLTTTTSAGQSQNASAASAPDVAGAEEAATGTAASLSVWACEKCAFRCFGRSLPLCIYVSPSTLTTHLAILMAPLHIVYFLLSYGVAKLNVWLQVLKGMLTIRGPTYYAGKYRCGTYIDNALLLCVVLTQFYTREPVRKCTENATGESPVVNVDGVSSNRLSCCRW